MLEIKTGWPYKLYKGQTTCDTHMPWNHAVLMEHSPARLWVSASLTVEILPHSHHHGPAPEGACPWETPYCPDQAPFQRNTFIGQKKRVVPCCVAVKCDSLGISGSRWLLPQLGVCLFINHQHNTCSHITGCVSLTCHCGATQTEGRGKLRDQVEHG